MFYEKKKDNIYCDVEYHGAKGIGKCSNGKHEMFVKVDCESVDLFNFEGKFNTAVRTSIKNCSLSLFSKLYI